MAAECQLPVEGDARKLELLYLWHDCSLEACCFRGGGGGGGGGVGERWLLMVNACDFVGSNLILHLLPHAASESTACWRIAVSSGSLSRVVMHL